MSFSSTIGLIITSLLLFVIFKISVSFTLNLKSFPAASKIISLAESRTTSLVKLVFDIVVFPLEVVISTAELPPPISSAFVDP